MTPVRSAPVNLRIEHVDLSHSDRIIFSPSLCALRVLSPFRKLISVARNQPIAKRDFSACLHAYKLVALLGVFLGHRTWPCTM